MPHRRCHGSVSGIGCTSAGGVRHDEAFQNGKGGGDEEGHEEERTDAEKNSYTRATGVACDEALLDGGGNGEEEEEEEERGGCEEEMEKEEECLEEFLRRLTGEENLGLVQNLLLTAVDTNVTQVDNLGVLVPNLTELRFGRGSTLASFRDFGSSLVNLRVLWLPACGVCHLDGVGALTGLEELYLAFNDVEDLTSIALHDRLEVLDLESNSVTDVEQAVQLSTCPRLWSLTLTANPVVRDRRYRKLMVEAVPQLATLDDENVTDSDRCPHSLPVEGAANTLLTGSPQCSSLQRAKPLESNSSTISLGAGEEGNRNLRETSTRVLSGNLEVAGAMRSGDYLQMKANRTGSLPIDASFSCHQFHPEDNPVKSGLELSGSYSWLTGARSIVTTACYEYRQGGAGADESGHSSGKDRSRSEQKGGRGTGTAFCGGTPKVGLIEVDRGNYHDEKNDPNNGDNAADTALFVDEEELVGKAIKALRTTAPKSDSLKWLSEDDRRVVADEKDGRDSIEQGREDRQQTIDAAAKGQSPMDKTVGAFKSTQGEGPSSSAGHGKEPAPDRVHGGDDWLIKFLRIEDIGPAANGNAPNEGRSQASSSLTHGSEFSIAGNPALGLRRRRTRQRPPSIDARASSASLLDDSSYNVENADTVILGNRSHAVTVANSRGASSEVRSSNFVTDTAGPAAGTTPAGTTAMVDEGGGVWASGRCPSRSGNGEVETTTRSSCYFPPTRLARADATSSADRRSSLVRIEAPRPGSGEDGSVLREAGKTKLTTRPCSGNDGEFLHDTGRKKRGERPRSSDDVSIFFRHAGREKLGSRPLENDRKFLPSGENKIATRPCSGDDSRNFANEARGDKPGTRPRGIDDDSKVFHDAGETKQEERPRASGPGGKFVDESVRNKPNARPRSGGFGRNKLEERPCSCDGDPGKIMVDSGHSKQFTEKDAVLSSKAGNSHRPPANDAAPLCIERLSSTPAEDARHARLLLVADKNTAECFPMGRRDGTVAFSKSMSVLTSLQTPSRLGWLETGTVGRATVEGESHAGRLEARSVGETTGEGESHVGYLETRKLGETTGGGEAESGLGQLETRKPWEAKGERGRRRSGWAEAIHHRDKKKECCSRGCQHGLARGPRDRCSEGAEPPSAVMKAVGTDDVVHTGLFADDALIDGEMESGRCSYTLRPPRQSQGLLEDGRERWRQQDGDGTSHDRTSRKVSEVESGQQGGDALRPSQLSSPNGLDDGDHRGRRRCQEDDITSDTRSCKGGVEVLTTVAGGRDCDAPEWSPGASAISEGGLGFDGSVVDDLDDLTTDHVRVGASITAFHSEKQSRVGGSVPALQCDNFGTTLFSTPGTGFSCARGSAAVHGLDEEDETKTSTLWLKSMASRGYGHSHPNSHPHHHLHHHSHPNFHPHHDHHPNDRPYLHYLHPQEHQHHHDREREMDHIPGSRSEKAATVKHRRKSDEGCVGGNLERRGTMGGQRRAFGDGNRLTPLPRERSNEQIPKCC